MHPWPSPAAPVAPTHALAPEARAAVAAAVAAAEARTSAEIRVAVREAPVVRHAFYSVLWAALAALLLPWPLAFATELRPTVLLSAQAMVFVALAAVLLLPNVAPRVVPRSARRAAVRNAALEQFLALGIPQTEGRTGILILAAAADRMVEVVADEGVHRLLGHEAWGAICAAVSERAAAGRLGEGLVAGVALAGEILSGPLPREPGDRDELDNRVVIL